MFPKLNAILVILKLNSGMSTSVMYISICPLDIIVLVDDVMLYFL